MRFAVERYGIIMSANRDDQREHGGTLNPGGVRGLDGHYYLFPRLVAADNSSRIGLARVRRGLHGEPVGVERLGVVLEPHAPYERFPRGGEGCEDARVTWIAALEQYLMAYVAVGPQGPQLALASSRGDLSSWTRHGLIRLAHERGVDFSLYMNKDGMLVPEPVPAPDGVLSLALLHRPVYERWYGPRGSSARRLPLPQGVSDPRPSIWISFAPLHHVRQAMREGAPVVFGQHHCVAAPVQDWEAYRIGGGTVPVRVAEGWLTFYHGVEVCGDGRRYCAGAPFRPVSSM